MPRKARQLSKTGIYHVMVRGINGKNIFHDEDDYKRYLGYLAQISEEGAVQVFGYCLMSNHVHLLFKEAKDSIARIMKRLGGSYAYWYNWKYERRGYLFQDRFKSENIEDDDYLKTVIRYIHQNPVKAGITEKPETYPWSSCAVYYGGKEQYQGLIKTSFILGLFDEGGKNAIKRFRSYMEENIVDDDCLDYKQSKRLSDREAEQILKEISGGRPLEELKNMAKKDRDLILSKMKSIEGITVRQISRLTGIGTTTVHNAQ